MIGLVTPARVLGRQLGAAIPLTGPPNADISRDLRVLAQLDPNAFADGTYFMYPGTIAGGNPYFGGDLGDIRGSAYVHPFNAAKPRNGWLRLTPWIPGTVEYDGSLTAGGAALSNPANGGGFGHNDFNSSNGVAALRTIFEGIRWRNSGPGFCGSSKIIFGGCVSGWDSFAAYKAQFDAVCTQLGIPIVAAPPNTAQYQNVVDSNLFKRNSEADGYRLQQGNGTRCTEIHHINCDILSAFNDGIFLGGTQNHKRRGCRIVNIHNPTSSGTTLIDIGALLRARWHSDWNQLTGGEDNIDVDFELVNGTDLEFSAETGSFGNNIVYGTKTGATYNMWNMGSFQAPVVIDNSTHSVGSGTLRWQWYAAGQNPFGSGYDNGFDVEKAVINTVGTLTLDFSHVLPSNITMINGGTVIADTNELFTHPQAPPNLFRVANPSLDAIYVALGLLT